MRPTGQMAARQLCMLYDEAVCPSLFDSSAIPGISAIFICKSPDLTPDHAHPPDPRTPDLGQSPSLALLDKIAMPRDDSPRRENLLEKGEHDGYADVERVSPGSQARGLLRNVGQMVYGLVGAVRPSIFSRAPKKPVKLRRTAYLDGMRGFAALLVYILHHQLWAHISFGGFSLQHGFGYNGTYYFATFPGIRTFFTGGHYAVGIFFILSGYVLSAKPLSCIHAADYVGLEANVASALFRRWLRLYLPIIITTFLIWHFWHVFGIWMEFTPEPTYRQELWKWYSEFKNFSFVFTTGGFPWSTYNSHTWSIPVEMKGSIAVYTTCIAVSRMRTNARLLTLAALVYYFMYIADGAYFAFFSAGILLSDLDLLALEDQLPGCIAWLKPYKTPLAVIGFVVSIWLGGCPSFDNEKETLRKQFGWYYASFIVPQAVFDYKWFFLFWAAVLQLIVVPHLPPIKRFFETRFCQYLGRISYMFYLVHGPILASLGDRMYAMVGLARPDANLNIADWVNRFPLPAFGPFGLELNFLACQMVLLPFTFWVAEIATTLIDDPVLRFCQWLYKMTLPAE
ncbi:hypothetical protein K470DRAFT_261443 [Piedraia hortae CBS 480.64]|uniref:Acyltransferase 3 domain-containing protein n=1 Tax=Piedraia hortae CBS 480.64 TaxID=1314780 RepID=A0A6A7C8S8_9PEZI|nr:hypothetical protein K470DRAFT_261443 [Piedraia hortae CBS 480.64]